MSKSQHQLFKLTYYRERKYTSNQIPESVRETSSVMAALGSHFYLMQQIFANADISGEQALAHLIEVPGFALPDRLLGHCFCLRVERDSHFDWYIFGAVMNSSLVLPAAPTEQIGVWNWKAGRIVGQSYAHQWLNKSVADWLVQAGERSYVMSIAGGQELTEKGAPSQAIGSRWKGILWADVAKQLHA
jgi:hypothetical protein